MSTPKLKQKKKAPSKRKVNIKLSSKVELVQKNDKIRQAQVDTLRKAPSRPPATVAPVFRVKIKKKNP